MSRPGTNASTIFLWKSASLWYRKLCRGNARKYGLRPSGRRNALGSVLTKRRCMWFSGCSPTMALVFRCNNHTSPNYRIPITSQTHDPDCDKDCLEKDISSFFYFVRLATSTLRSSKCSKPLFHTYSNPHLAFVSNCDANQHVLPFRTPTIRSLNITFVYARRGGREFQSKGMVVVSMFRRRIGMDLGIRGNERHESEKYTRS